MTNAHSKEFLKTIDEQIKRLYPQADDEWVTALRKGAGKDGSLSSDSTIKSALAPRLREGPDKGKALNTSISKKDLPEIQKDQDDFKKLYEFGRLKIPTAFFSSLSKKSPNSQP